MRLDLKQALRLVFSLPNPNHRREARQVNVQTKRAPQMRELTAEAVHQLAKLHNLPGFQKRNA